MSRALPGGLPGRMIRAVSRRVSSPIFVGRVAERAMLSDALEQAVAGQPGIVLITGEAGVGKSRLLTEATALAEVMGVTAVSGACVDVAAGTLPYGPVLDVVRDLHRAGLTTTLPAQTRAELGRLVPEVASERHGGPGGEQGGQGRLFAAVRDALALSSASKPLLVAIEDLHWADASTLDLVTYLARSMQTERCLIVATVRLDTVHRQDPILGMVAELARLPWLERIDLERFDEGELVQQLTGIMGHVPDAATARDVFERSDGNAFFAEELVASGAVPRVSLPASLREVLAARLAELDDVSQRLVRVAAVAGRAVSHELLEHVAGMPSSVLIEALREAVDHRVLLHVVDPSPGYAFRHALVREAAYDELLPAERIALHRSIADALERDESASPAGELARTGEIAFHAMAAQDYSRALTASLAAAAAAEQASAHAEAEVHLDRIVEIWPRFPDAATRVGMDHADLLVRTAHAAAAAGHLPRAVAAAQSALAELEPDDMVRRVTTLLELFDYAYESADLATADRVVVEAVPILREEVSARSARAFAAQAMFRWHNGRYTDACEAASQAIEVARACSARTELARALTILAVAFTHLGETNHAEAAFAEAAAILEEIRDPGVRARSTRWRAWGRYMHGRFEEAVALTEVGLEIARREGSDGRYGVDFLDAAFENLVELGRWDDARLIGEQIVARTTVTLEMLGAHMSLARLNYLQGRIAEAEHEIAVGAQIASVGPHLLWQLEEAIALAYATGRHDDGRLLMESALQSSPEPDRDAILWWPLRKAVAGEADRAEAARRRRRTAEADEAAATARRFAEALRRSAQGAIDADGGGRLVRAEVSSVDAEERRADGRSDPARWATVVAAREELGQPWELAYARYRMADAILASEGPSAEAEDSLRDAHAGASGLGAAPLQAAIESLASRARIQLDGTLAAADPAVRSATTLTARELEVLSLVAAGHTNREIGDRLFISEKTASVHVTHAMDKLGALSRYEAAAMATRLGLLEPTPLP